MVLLALGERVLPRNGVVIDIGCGTGANLAAFGASHERVGVDPDPEAIRAASTRYPELDFRRGAAPGTVADVLPRANLVLMTDVLEHVREDRDLLASIVDLMPPAAHVLLTVPADPTLWSPHDTSFGHFRRYTPETFRAIWSDLPVSERVVGPWNRRLYYPIRAARWLSRKTGRAAGIRGSDFFMLPRPLNRALTALLAGEGAALVEVLDGGAGAVSGRGVSLVAVLRKQ